MSSFILCQTSRLNTRTSQKIVCVIDPAIRKSSLTKRNVHCRYPEVFIYCTVVVWVLHCVVCFLCSDVSEKSTVPVCMAELVQVDADVTGWKEISRNLPT